MKAAIFKGKNTIEVGQRSDPHIEDPTDAIVRVVRGCVCGSDLWYYRGINPHKVGSIGHEYIGVIETVGPEVRDLAVGDFVIAPFTYNDGTCPACRAGYQSNCVDGGAFGNGDTDGGQGEKVRAPFADATLVKVPNPPQGRFSDEQLASFTALSDVACTGYHAAVSAGIQPGDTVAVVGDGAAKVLRLTDGVGVDAALECVGTDQSIATCAGITRAGGMIGAVGVPLYEQFEYMTLFWKNIGIKGGVAPARHYIPELLEDVLAGRINPGLVFDYSTDLDHVADAYAAMDERRAIKSLLTVSNP
jgi:threonine dehydrogenase-like Zn-dependent dehydrogenase